VYDPANRNADLSGLMIVNLRTQHGVFGTADGSFLFTINQNDSIIIAAIGYEFVRIYFRDSADKPVYILNIPLKKKEVTLPEVRIMAPRDMEEIEKDIQKLGYNKRDYELSGINVLESPITFLYQEFSRKERLRRHNAQVVNETKRRQLLKELLSRFVADNIIDLTDENFDRFIDFCDVSEEFMKHSTQYDFMVYVKNRYELFAAMNDYYRE
jgi:hypothetical protein